jgi:hypothetical protein
MAETPGFKDIKLTWRGRAHTLPADRVIDCIAAVEGMITVGELHRILTSGDMPFARLSKAYAILLQHAGDHGATAEEVYASLFGSPDQAITASQCCQTLVALMVPPGLVKPAQPTEQPAADVEPVKS